MWNGTSQTHDNRSPNRILTTPRETGDSAEARAVSDASWPDRLQDAADAHAVPQVFGWQPATWGTTLLSLCLWLRLVQPTFSPGESLLWWFLLGVGAALWGHEIRRRRHQAWLLLRGEQIGLYRAGRLRHRFPRADIAVYLTQRLNTAKAVFGLLFGAIIAAALAFISARLQDRLMAVVTLLAFVFSAASCYSSRERSTQLLVPSPHGHRQWVGVRREDGKRLLAEP